MDARRTGCYSEAVRFCSISIDLDEIDHYAAIHGLGQGGAARVVYECGLSRSAAFAEACDVPLTLFVITRDLSHADNVARLQTLANAGHELANHTENHHYDLTRRPRAEQLQEVRTAMSRLGEITGHAPTGFRAPGYTITNELFDVIAECGVRYDSSVFPCPPYYAAKLAVLAGMKMLARTSRSIVGSANVLRAPTAPYRVGRPFWRHGGGLMEFPIQVVGPLRVPFIGTTLSLLGPSAARFLARSLARQPFINLELHGIDFLDASDGLANLARHQPDLRIPVKRKLETFRAVVAELRRSGYDFVRLDRAASVFSELHPA